MRPLVARTPPACHPPSITSQVSSQDVTPSQLMCHPPLWHVTHHRCQPSALIFNPPLHGDGGSEVPWPLWPKLLLFSLYPTTRVFFRDDAERFTVIAAVWQFCVFTDPLLSCINLQNTKRARYWIRRFWIGLHPLVQSLEDLTLSECQRRSFPAPTQESQRNYSFNFLLVSSSKGR